MRILAITTAAMLLAAAGNAAAQSIDCGEIYSIQRGDTLRGVAQRAYGVGDFRTIYEANVAVIGANPDLIEVGMRLTIPCRTAQAAPAPEPAAVAPAAPTANAANAAPAVSGAPGAGPARLIGVDGNPPFSGSELPGGGLFTELLVQALARSGAPAGEVDFAPDWAAQAAALLPGGGYDVGFPWVRPDCAQAAALGAESRARCRSFDFSDPFFEVVLSFYTLDGSEYAAISSHREMLGARICRPDGMFVGDLEAEGLVEPHVSLVTPPTAQDCFAALMIGEVNIVSTDALTAEQTLASVPGAARRVRELDGLATLQTLHAAAPRGSAVGREALARLDEGLKRMRATGEWFAAVQKYRASAASGG
jgi:polar amino acid transport system substrate-binding protein